MWFPRSLADLRSIDILSVLKQSIFIPTPTWSVNQIPDLAGKVIIVTGGNTGIGKETAKALLNHNAKVYLACRNQQSAEVTISDLENDTGRRAVFLRLDLADLTSVKAAANEFLRKVRIHNPSIPPTNWLLSSSKEEELHLLFNNAGVMFPPHSLLVEGYDLQFHTNVTGHWYLTKLLIPIMLNTAKNSPPKSVRVLHVSSGGQYLIRSQCLDFASFRGGPKRDKYDIFELYFQSKFGNVVVSNEVHRRYADQGLVSISLNPGNINTELYRHLNPFVRIAKKMLSPPDLGALTQLYGGIADEAGDYGGEFLIPWARLGKAHPETNNPEVGKALWEWLEEQVADL